MGESKRRKEFNMNQQQMNQQLQQAMKYAKPLLCECGCGYYYSAVVVSVIPAVASPLGKETRVNQKALICLKCNKPLGSEEGEKVTE